MFSYRYLLLSWALCVICSLLKLNTSPYRDVDVCVWVPEQLLIGGCSHSDWETEMYNYIFVQYVRVQTAVHHTL